MRANTIVILGAVVVAVIGGTFAYRVGGLKSIVPGIGGAAPQPAPNIVATAPSTAGLVPASGKLHDISLPYYVIRQTDGDPVLAAQTTSLRVRGSAAIWRQAHTALTALAAFPTTRGSLRSPLPEGARILGVHVDNNGIATVDLSSQFRDRFNGGAREEQVTIYAIVNTVGAVKGINGVRFAVNGQPIDEFAGHLDLSSPLTPDASLVEPAP